MQPLKFKNLMMNSYFKEVNSENYKYLTNEVKAHYNELYQLGKYNDEHVDPVFIEKLQVSDDSKILIFGDLHSSLHSFFRSLDEKKENFFETPNDLSDTFQDDNNKSFTPSEI